MDDYKKHQTDCKRIRRENSMILDKFAVWLKAKQLSNSTIKNHVNNIDFYANEFLLYEKAIEVKDGASQIGMFLGYWFIRKAMWSSSLIIVYDSFQHLRFAVFMDYYYCPH